MLGPKDRRLRTTRCLACAKRKVKCEGGFPCILCARSGRVCTPPVQNQKTGLVIVHDGRSKSASFPVVNLPPVVPLDFRTRLSKHFFCNFLLANQFAINGSIDSKVIGQLQHSTQSLHEAIFAVSALDASRNSSKASLVHSQHAERVALQAYKSSVVSLQVDIQDGRILKSDAGLWCTFFLGIFELMYDTTGEGWIKHVLYGTSQLLKLRGPSACLEGSGRSFFLTMRLFEICRALIYNESTFLEEPAWTSMMQQMWPEGSSEEWHPVESLFDLVISCSSLSMRGHALDHQDEAMSTHELISMANDGLALQHSLYEWYKIFLSWSTLSPPTQTDAPSLVASIYFHAIVIFLSGIFEYRSYWDDIDAPKLSTAQVQQYMLTILSEVEHALKNTRLAGILFFCPLSIAGARCRSSTERSLILSMLYTIAKRNFVVAGAFVDDLTNLWKG